MNIKILCIFLLFSSPLYSQSLVMKMLETYNAPNMKEIGYTEINDILEINFDEKRIYINPENMNSQLIEIYQKETVLFSFDTKYIIDKNFISGIYLIKLTPSGNDFLLISAYLKGSTGISANISFGLLVNLEEKKYQYLSTWGDVKDGFRDLNNDGLFEFICIDAFFIEKDMVLVPNIFYYANGLFSVNNSMITNTIIVFSQNESKIKTINTNDLFFLTVPDILEFDKY